MNGNSNKAATIATWLPGRPRADWGWSGFVPYLSRVLAQGIQTALLELKNKGLEFF